MQQQITAPQEAPPSSGRHRHIWLRLAGLWLALGFILTQWFPALAHPFLLAHPISLLPFSLVAGAIWHGSHLLGKWLDRRYKRTWSWEDLLSDTTFEVCMACLTAMPFYVILLIPLASAIGAFSARHKFFNRGGKRDQAEAESA